MPQESPFPVQPADEHNRALVENVHPPGHRNPAPAEKYHLVVIGAGTGGLVSAAGAAGLGARVALVERHLLGGDCLNVGCVPSKGIIRSARAAASVRDSEAFGVHHDGYRIDFGAAMERMRRLRARISPNDSVSRFTGLGVDVFLGEGRFVSGDSVEVAGARLRFARAIIATGARAAAPPIPGLGETGYLTNENVFELTERPERLAVIGGGPIGSELSQAFARLGTEVHLFEITDHVLSREEPDAASVVQGRMERDGVALHLGVKLLRVEEHGGKKRIVFEKAGKEDSVDCSEILVGAGRASNVEGLGLDAAGVRYDRRGVEVEDTLRTTNRRIYAVGDVASKYKFTHAADALARIALANALFRARQKASRLVIPWCTYTDPEVGHVGLYEKEAQGMGIETQTIKIPLAEVDRAVLDGEEEGFAKFLLKKGSDKILGATVVASHAGDIISEIVLAMTNGIGLLAFSKTIHSYPTQGEVLKRAGDAYNRTRLTPLNKKVLGLLLRLVR